MRLILINNSETSSDVLRGSDACEFNSSLDLNSANGGASGKISPIHALMSFGEKTYWLVVCPICLDFLLCFPLVSKYAFIKTAAKGTFVNPLLIFYI